MNVYIDDDFDKMDFKQLRAAVRELNDNYVKLKRLVEDAVFNIDKSNLGSEIIRKLDNNEASMKITADKISSMVSKKDLEKKLEQYTTAEQTSEAIKLSAKETREYSDKENKEMSADFEITAGQISSNVRKVMNKAERNYSSISQTADKIALIVVECIDTTDPDSYFESDKYPPARTTRGYDTTKLCKVGNKFYYFNAVSQRWQRYNVDSGIKSMFEQTAHGFVFTNNVRINGDLVTYGTISGIDIAGVRFWGNKKLPTGNNHGAYFKIVSNVGDLGLFDRNTDNDDVKDNNRCIWGISQRDVVTMAVTVK